MFVVVAVDETSLTMAAKTIACGGFRRRWLESWLESTPESTHPPEVDSSVYCADPPEVGPTDDSIRDSTLDSTDDSIRDLMRDSTLDSTVDSTLD